MSTCISWHSQLRMGSFCRSKVLPLAWPCSKQPAHSDYREDVTNWKIPTCKPWSDPHEQVRPAWWTCWCSAAGRLAAESPHHTLDARPPYHCKQTPANHENVSRNETLPSVTDIHGICNMHAVIQRIEHMYVKAYCQSYFLRTIFSWNNHNQSDTILVRLLQNATQNQDQSQLIFRKQMIPLLRWYHNTNTLTHKMIPTPIPRVTSVNSQLPLRLLWHIQYNHVTCWNATG